MAGACFEQIVQRDESEEFTGGALHNGHTRETVLCHAINHDTQRFVRIGFYRLRPHQLSESRLQHGVSFALQPFTDIASSEHSYEPSVCADNRQQPLLLTMVSSQ